MINLKNKKVLITGGAGFVGSHLAISLLDQGYEVVALDNLSTGNYSNIEKLIQNKSFSFIKHDIKENINLDADYYINLASPASPIHYQKDPIDTLLTSVLGTRNILELAKKNNATILEKNTDKKTVIIGANPYTAELICKSLINKDIWNPFKGWDLISKPKNLDYKADLYLEKNKNFNIWLLWNAWS